MFLAVFVWKSSHTFPSVISMAEQMEVGLAAADAMHRTEYEAGAAPDILSE